MYYSKLSGFSDEISSDTTIQFEVLKKLGIKYYEPRGIDGKNISELLDNEILALKKKMEKFEISASSIGSPIGKIKLSDDFDEHFNLFKKVVKTAKMLNARYIRMFSFYHDDDEWAEEERKDVFQKLTKMIEYAKTEDVVLLHENEKDIYGDTVERCIDLMKELGCENFRAVFDPANFVQCGENTKNAIEKLLPYVEYMHIKDSEADTLKVVPAGYGDGNIEYVLKTLFDNGYNGFISLEPHLGNFEGLAALEQGDIMDDLEDGGEGTFTLAYNSLGKIINKLFKER